ncbi:hypothetical protein NM688_g7200 [Phlebia brevispora]|uniref:Uncharacterized protein n=1 Tax=Phlebia brevispora TaxID=194682 RepID=A0ACC1S868_9APHY|nr:hypothetical protein NM688_g7200 [Phlebia brevispora]
MSESSLAVTLSVLQHIVTIQLLFTEMSNTASPQKLDLDDLSPEDRIQLALEAVCDSGLKPNGDPCLSLRQAAQIYRVSHSTLTARFHGRPTCRQAHEHERKLSQIQENVLVAWIKVVGRRGIPFSPQLVQDYASELAEEPVGDSWVRRFAQRHPDLKLSWTTNLEQCRARALNRHLVQEYFHLIHELILKYNLTPENIYNMDEKGIMLGIGRRTRAFVDRDQKTLYQIEDGNRELVTVIECISADGTALRPSVIYQGTRRDLEWGRNNPCGASISHSPNGWTDQELGAIWLEKDFEPQTAARNSSGGYRLLILDGHNSHCTYRFCSFAEKHNIIVVCLPAHTTHALQPCDVGVFGPLETCWRAVVTQAGRDMVRISKLNLLQYYHEARTQAFKASTIRNAFRKTGIWPWNPDAIDVSLFEPSKNTTTDSAQPLPAALPSILVLDESTLPTTSNTQLPTIPEGTELPSTAMSSNAAVEPGPRYKIPIPPTPPHYASRQDLRKQVKELRSLVKEAGVQLEQSFTQMKLMDKENGQLRMRANKKEKRPTRRLDTTHARHLTDTEALERLARADWDKNMKAVFAEAKQVFKLRRKVVTDYEKAIAAAEKLRREQEKAEKKEVQNAAKQAEKEARKAAPRGRRTRGPGKQTAVASEGERRIRRVILIVREPSEIEQAAEITDSQSEDDDHIPNSQSVETETMASQESTSREGRDVHRNLRRSSRK